MKPQLSIVEEIIAHAKIVPPPSKLEKLPFIEAIWPWSGAARARLLAQAGSTLASVAPEVISQLENEIVCRWVDLCASSMMLELEVDKLQGSLKGRSSKARYNHFIERHFRDPNGLRIFFEEYQELSRRVSLFLDQWAIGSSELLERLDHDVSLLSHFFNSGNPLGRLMSIRGSLGDPHRGGKSVALLSFESGKRLIYKPKNLGIVSAFHTLLSELNQLGLSPQLRGYQVLEREGYGWEEFVESSHCNDFTAVARYFERAGMMLCLMYLLDGVDVHKENLIANGEFPILIDLETLFHSLLAIPLLKSSVPVDNFVLKTGMLPVFLFNRPNKQGIDCSALGAVGGERIPFFLWRKLGSEDIHAVRKLGRTKDCRQRVLCKGKKVSSERYVNQIVKGFRTMYAFITRHRSYILRDKGPLAQMAHLPVRRVIRSTQFYADLLESLRNGQAILDPSLIEKKLKLLSISLDEKRVEYFGPMIDEEKKALLDGNIPYFTVYPSHRHLYAETETALIENAFKTTPFDSVCNRIKSMNEADCHLQESYIRASFFMKSGKQNNRSLPLQSIPKKKDQTETVIHLAKELKRRSFSIASGGLHWIDLEFNPISEQYNLGPISDNLYGGRMGLALFFSALFCTSGDLGWRESAMGCLTELSQKIDENQTMEWIDLVGIGGFTGVGGLIYGLVHCSRLLNEEGYIERAKKLSAAIEERHIEEDLTYDIIGGSAGLILSLLQLYEVSPDPSIIKLASLCGDRLSLCSKRMEKGGGWRDEGGTGCRIGFSHGPAGIAYALLKLATATQKVLYFEAANRAMEYERRFYNKEEKNWPFSGSKSHLFQAGWCYGAAGIGLGRLASLPLVHDERIEEEIKAAIITTEKYLRDPRGSPNLCCTHIGRLEFLIEAARRLDMPDLLQRSEEAVPMLLEQVKNLNEFFIPGLMKGAAGIGYTLLRLQDKTRRLPQVLLLS